jgi:hypothetical protein
MVLPWPIQQENAYALASVSLPICLVAHHQRRRTTNGAQRVHYFFLQPPCTNAACAHGFQHTFYKP